jgi:hypothetical protein
MLASGQELLVRKQIYSIGGKFITVAIALRPATHGSEATSD